VGQVVLQPPQPPADDPGIWLEPLAVWALWLHEPAAPAGAEAVDCLLLTNVAISTWAEATRAYQLVWRTAGHRVVAQGPQVGLHGGGCPARSG
jgi:hypothetical protein